MLHLLTRYNYGAWFVGAVKREFLKARFLLTDIHQANVLALDELECYRNILQFLRSKRRFLVVSCYFLVRKDL